MEMEVVASTPSTVNAVLPPKSLVSVDSVAAPPWPEAALLAEVCFNVFLYSNEI
jgi:hypothetical protein